ncbi:MAG: hypothetical protein Q4D91_04525 [Lautropia sp.]|nr:hypothetical protein [Lautropia sp.]
MCRHKRWVKEFEQADPAITGRAARRRVLSALPCLALMMPGWMKPAVAHHGFLGKYQFSRPMFLKARVVRITGGLPHVRMVVDVSRGGGRVPRGREWMRPLEDAEARPTLTILAPFDKRGEVELTFDWRLSRLLLEEPDLLREGDQISAVVYRRTAADEYHGELLVVLLRTPDEQVLVSARPVSSVKSRRSCCDGVSGVDGP